MSKMRVAFSFDDLLIDVVHTTLLGSFWCEVNLFSHHWRLYCHDTAGAAVYNQDMRLALEPGWIYLIPPCTRLRGTVAEDRIGSIWQFHMHFNFLTEDAPLSAALQYFKADKQLLQHLWRIPGLGPSAYREREILAAGVLLQSLGEALGDSGTSIDLPEDGDPRVAKAMLYMSEHLGDDISVDLVAKYCGMSKSALIRLFKREIGRTPWKYFTHMRMGQAALMLHATDTSIDTIAEQLGYSDRFQFSRCFKAHTRQSPAHYRKIGPAFPQR